MIPDATVIVLNYNYAAYLRAAIESALSQENASVRVVVVDDGSTDDSRRIIEEYGSRIVFVSKSNGGMDTALNAGWQACQQLGPGKFVVFLDADDLLLRDAIAALKPVFESEDVAKAHWRMPVIDAQGRRTGAFVPAAKLSDGSILPAILQSGPDAFHGSPTSGNAWAAWVLEKILPMPEAGFKRHAEMYLQTLAPVLGHVKHVETPLSCYRMHGRNDFAAARIEEKNERNLCLYDARCRALAELLKREQRSFDAHTWEEGRNAYLWMKEVENVITALIPAGDRYAILDEAQWVAPEALRNRAPLPFPNQDGCFAGPPVDASSAIADLERARERGVKWLLVCWPAFWWLTYYAPFAVWLEARYPAAYKTERVILYDLTQATTA